jgi:hypothetical protein
MIVRKHYQSEEEEHEMVMKANSKGIQGVPNGPKSDLPTKPAGVESLEWLMVQKAFRQAEEERLVAKARSRPQTLDEAATFFQTTRWAVQGVIERNRIPTERVGRSIVVKVEDLLPYLRRLPG